MKHVYWRPSRIPGTALVLIAILAMAGLASVEVFLTREKQPFYPEKTRAARLTEDAFTVLHDERLRRKIAIDPESDPTQSGLIGNVMSPVTSNTGSLVAKQTTINPNFAAVAVHLLKRAGVEEGDVVAVGFSGSFPAINVCVLAALETIKARPILISSTSASSWGANEPSFLWIDMERALAAKHVFATRSIAASIGGVEDRGLGMDKSGVRALKRAIARQDLPFLDPTDYEDSVEQRMALYYDAAAGEPIKAYVNVGGGTTSVGTKIGKQMFRPGLNRRAPVGGPAVDSVMSRMINDGIPVIHFVHIARLAERYGLPIQPTTIPKVGEGKVFYRDEYNTILVAGVLATILIVLYIFVRSDWGFRILVNNDNKKSKTHPAPMV